MRASAAAGGSCEARSASADRDLGHRGGLWECGMRAVVQGTSDALLRRDWGGWQLWLIRTYRHRCHGGRRASTTCRSTFLTAAFTGLPDRVLKTIWASTNWACNTDSDRIPQQCGFNPTKGRRKKYVFREMDGQAVGFRLYGNWTEYVQQVTVSCSSAKRPRRDST